MWRFIYKALKQKTYGDLFYVVKEEEEDFIFAVKAENQKNFRLNFQELDKSWVLFLDYGKYKLGKKFEKPTTTQQYTHLRSRFFNALVRCNCPGRITKIQKPELKELNLDKNCYKYYKYIACEYDKKVEEMEAIPSNLPSIRLDDERNLQPGDLLLCVYEKNGIISLKKNLGQTKLAEAESLLLGSKCTELFCNSHTEDIELSFYQEHLTPPSSIQQFDEDLKLPFEELDIESELFSEILL